MRPSSTLPKRRFRIGPAAFLLLLALVATGLVFVVHRIGQSSKQSASQLVGMLPSGDATIFYADVALIRRMGLLSMFADPNAPQDAEYKAFVQETHFDYTKDIDDLTAAWRGDDIYILVAGNPRWPALKRYAISHGGVCNHEFCNLPASKQGKWVSFHPVSSNTLALAVSNNPRAAQAIDRNKPTPPTDLPT